MLTRLLEEVLVGLGHVLIPSLHPPNHPSQSVSHSPFLDFLVHTSTPTQILTFLASHCDEFSTPVSLLFLHFSVHVLQSLLLNSRPLSFLTSTLHFLPSFLPLPLLPCDVSSLPLASKASSILTSFLIPSSLSRPPGNSRKKEG